jgi:hypothetical protein
VSSAISSIRELSACSLRGLLLRVEYAKMSLMEGWKRIVEVAVTYQ